MWIHIMESLRELTKSVAFNFWYSVLLVTSRSKLHISLPKAKSSRETRVYSVPKLSNVLIERNKIIATHLNKMWNAAFIDPFVYNCPVYEHIRNCTYCLCPLVMSLPRAHIFHFRVYGDDDGLIRVTKRSEKLTSIPHFTIHFDTSKWQAGLFTHGKYHTSHFTKLILIK